MKKCAIDNSVLQEALNTLFERTEYATAKASEQVKITGLRLSLLSGIPDERWRESASGELVRGGFTSRLLLVTPSTEIPPGQGVWPGQLDQAREAGFVSELARRLKGLPPEGLSLGVTEEAKQVYMHWEKGLPKEEAT